MKRIYRTAAALMAAVCIAAVGGCRFSDKPPEEESSITEEAASPEPSEQKQDTSKKEESKKEESGKKESSKPKAATSSKPEESVAEKTTPHLGPVYVDSSRDVISDLSGYYASNHDTVGWISVPNTLTNNVVLQHKEDAYEIPYGSDPYYLYKDFYGNYFFSGSLFLDYRSTIEDKNQLIHGHSMADGTMFAGLLYYDSLSFYQSGPVVTYNTLYEKAKWKIISIATINTNEELGSVFRYLRSSFASDYDFLNYVYQMRARSVINCPVTVNESDTLLTLSTCTGYSYGVEGLRMVVLARKVRPGEDSRVKVSDATYASNPLQPDIYYRYYGGTRPTLTSFQDALNKKQITWYDGKRKWTAKDDETLAKALVQVKKDAHKMISESYKPEEYYASQLKQIQGIIDVYKPYIDEAEDFARVNDLVIQEIACIEHVSKKPEDVLKAEQKQREEEKKKLEQEAELKAKAEAEEKARLQKVDKIRKEIVSGLQNYVKGKHYRENQQKKVNDLINTYKEKVYTTDDLEILEQMKTNSMRLISEIQTDEQLTSKEKASGKTNQTSVF